MEHVPNFLAACTVSLEPRIVMIWVKAIRSSLALKKGYLPLRRESRMTPADHTSIARGLMVEIKIQNEDMCDG